MKQTEEKLNRLQSLTGVTLHQAEAALHAAKGDLLEALIWLEDAGFITSAGVGRYSTAGAPQPPQEELSSAQAPSLLMPEKRPESVKDWLKWLWMFLISNRLEAYKKYDPSRQIQCPMGVLIALVIIAWYAVAGVLILGICLGWRYRLAGPQLGGRKLNAIISQIDDLAEKARDDVKRHMNQNSKE